MSQAGFNRMVGAVKGDGSGAQPIAARARSASTTMRSAVVGSMWRPRCASSALTKSLDWVHAAGARRDSVTGVGGTHGVVEGRREGPGEAGRHALGDDGGADSAELICCAPDHHLERVDRAVPGGVGRGARHGRLADREGATGRWDADGGGSGQPVVVDADRVADDSACGGRGVRRHGRRDLHRGWDGVGCRGIARVLDGGDEGLAERLNGERDQSHRVLAPEREAPGAVRRSRS